MVCVSMAGSVWGALLGRASDMSGTSWNEVSMGKHIKQHSLRKSALSAVSVMLVFALVSYLAITNMRINRTATVTSDTSQLLNERARQATALQKQINALSKQIDSVKTLTDNADTATTSEDTGRGTQLPAVEGPGIQVTLDDSPLWQNRVDNSGSSADINDYVVHQQDLEGVINALWAGGAESMMIADQRVLPNTAVRCVGTVVTVHGKRIAPPYTISAIGPIEDMKQSLDNSPSVEIYKEYVSSIGLGWKVETKDKLKFPASSALQALTYAQVSQ